MTDFLEDKHQEINARLKELKPLVDEFRHLEAAAAALAGVIESATSNAGAAVVTRRRGPGRPRRSASRKTATVAVPKAARKPGRPPAKPRGGRRKGGGKRGTEVLSLVQRQPGIAIPELATKMGIKQNYLYRVLPGLEQEGKVEKKGRGWYPKGS